MISVNSKSHNYEVVFRQSTNFGLHQCHVLADETFADRNFLKRAKSVTFIRVDERDKNLVTVSSVMDSFNKNQIKKSDEIFAIGGGYIQDIATISASLYMRGISWNFVPTTLAAMGDSCLGGKSSINLGDTKNLIGNFFPPRQIIINVDFLHSLSGDDYLCGVSEMVKIATARGRQHLDGMLRVINLENLMEMRSTEWISAIMQSLNAKKYFIEADEFDTGDRKLLNFGHTFGHALEAASNFRIPHGIAVAFGMLVAINHPNSQISELSDALSVFIWKLLGKVSNLTLTEFNSINWDIYEKSLVKDKKNTATHFCPILLRGDTLYSAHLDFDGESEPSRSASISKKLVESFVSKGQM